ncbi:nucleoside hydrolase [Bacillus timonensis]|nr:nucleoside hydrolase [Bacillus timonensis]
MPMKVLYFADFGIDDIIGLIYAHFNPYIDIVGVVADYGNVPKSVAIQNARYLQKLTKREDIPIIAGAERPLTGMSPTFYPEVHGEQGLGPITIKDMTDVKFKDFYEVNNLINKYKDLIIVNVGRLTSLATIYILYPELVKNVKSIYIMGGAFSYPGNVTPVAEANFYSDPYAANLVLTLGERITIIPLNITQNAIITPDMVNYIDKVQKRNNSMVGEIIKPLMDYYFNFYKSSIPSIKGSPLHDVVTLWSALNEQYIYTENRPVKVIVNKSEAYGQSIADFRPYPMLIDYPKHRIGLNFSYSKYLEDFLTVMTRDM